MIWLIVKVAFTVAALCIVGIVSLVYWLDSPKGSEPWH